MCIGLANPSGMGNTFHGNYKIFAKKYKTSKKEIVSLQSGRSGLAKHGGAYFSAIYGSIEDPIAVPGPYENQEV